ncbi:MAG: hypothetical protein UHN02_03470 [Acutalibacteraceae bacterium]|nr:hypothetical protein [Acutalibacteraceae bacterium]
MRYIDVTARFYPDGVIVPICINWEDGNKFKIDRILDVRRAASLKSGGVGLRYTCTICGQIRNLYLDNNKWFI